MRRFVAAAWKVVLVACALLAMGLSRSSYPNSSPGWARAGGCPIVQSTPYFTVVYGSVEINDQPAVVGTVVEARTPRGEVVGCFVVETPGHYGMMYVYGEDENVSPPIPGMREGEAVTFTVNGTEATASPQLAWSNDHDMHEVVLAVDEYCVHLPLVLRGYRGSEYDVYLPLVVRE